MSFQRSPSPKLTILLIVFAFAMLILLLTGVSAMTSPNPQPPTLPAPVGYVVGFAAIIAAALLTVFRLNPSSGMGLQKFQVQMLICLAIAEFGCLVGFVGHLAAGTPMWPLSIGSEAVILVLILPRVLAFVRMQG
jgi:hypothetical protein